MDVNDLIRFIMDMMRDEDKKAAFDADPAGTLADCGLRGVTPRDVGDAETVMRDSGLAHPRGGGSTSGGHDNPVDAIRHVSTTYVVDKSVEVGSIHNELAVVDIDIDDRDVDIRDSNNGDTRVVAIQDNDTNTETTNNDVDVVNVDHSFNDNPAGPVDEPDSPDETESSDAEPSAAADPDTEPEPEPEPDSDPETEPDSDSDQDPVGHDPALSESHDEHVDYYAEDAADHAHAPVM